MTIASVASALPRNRYDQETITAALQNHWAGRLARPQLLERVHSRAGVATRYLAFPMERYARFGSWGETNAAWFEAAQELGERALSLALERAGLAVSQLDALIVVSVTGIASPSLDARLINRMGLRSDLKRTPIFGLGCVGGAVGLTRAADYVRAYPGQVAALLAVETCSLAIQREDFSNTNLVATALFGDGAGVALLTGEDRAAHGPRVLDCHSVFYPNTEEIMGWNISEHGFGIVLSPALPDLVRGRLRTDVDRFLNRHSLKRADIGNWLIHTGGPKVLDAMADALELLSDAMEVSWDCLRRFGNLSSASVLLVLEEVMLNRRPPAGTLSLLLALGPGFSSEIILLQW